MARRTAAPAAPVSSVSSVPSAPAVGDGVFVVGDVAVPLASIWVRVVIAHDGLYPDMVYEMACTERTQNLIGMGYLDMVAPPDDAL